MDDELLIANLTQFVKLLPEEIQEILARFTLRKFSRSAFFNREGQVFLSNVSLTKEGLACPVGRDIAIIFHSQMIIAAGSNICG